MSAVGSLFTNEANTDITKIKEFILTVTYKLVLLWKELFLKVLKSMAMANKVLGGQMV